VLSRFGQRPGCQDRTLFASRQRLWPSLQLRSRTIYLARVTSACFLLVLVCAVDAVAATNAWTDKYPKTGVMAGEIVVAGTVRADACFTIQTSGLIIVWPATGSGGVSIPNGGTDVKVDAMTGVWGPTTVGGLTSGQKYWVVVQCQQKNGAVVNTINTEPVTVTAK
jgi:hypothetical protein